MTARAVMATRAREREQVFVCTVVAADAREPVVEHAAGEERVGDLCDHGAPRAVLAREAVVVDRLQAVQMIRHQPKQRRRLRASGLVDATRHFAATSAWRRPHDACCCRADRPSKRCSLVVSSGVITSLLATVAYANLICVVHHVDGRSDALSAARASDAAGSSADRRHASPRSGSRRTAGRSPACSRPAKLHSCRAFRRMTS